MNKEMTPCTVREILEPLIRKAGGWVNAHAHADRAYTLSEEMLRITQTCTLQQKWDAIDRFKRESTEQDFYSRFCKFFEAMVKQGCTACATYVDIDPVAGDRAIKGALRAREEFKDDITIKYVNQAIKGVLEPEARRWFDIGTELVDIVGGIPMRDEFDYGRSAETFDIFLGRAKELGKPVQLHIDQFDSSLEYETEMLTYKTIEHGMQNRVTAIHCISIAAHTETYRQSLYKLMKEAGLMVTCCPTAWLDTRRSELPSPGHNAIAPVEELAAAGIPVSIGTDNVSDAVLPWTHGDLWTELRVLATACHFNEFDELVRIATVNGRKVMGI